jgi:hypothetical protein
MAKLVAFLILFLIGTGLRSGAQGTLSVAMRANFGFIDPNPAKLAYVLDSRPWLAELDISSQTTGKRAWQKWNGYPQFGAAILYGNSGSREFIGSVTGLVPYISLALFNRTVFYARLRLGVGAAWVQKVFNPETNYANFVISTHLNVCANALATLGIHVLPRTSLELGVSFFHISNGSVKLPNLGLNPTALSAGIVVDLHEPLPRRTSVPYEPALSERPQSETTQTEPVVNKKWGYYIYSFAAAKEAFPLESPVALVSVLNLEAMKDFSHTGRWGGGINLTYDRALSNEVANSGIFAFDHHKSQLEASVYAAYEYVVGRLSFPFQLGYYCYNNYPVNACYEMIGIKYRVTGHWIAGMALKAHLGNGDFIQWGLGYKI